MFVRLRLHLPYRAEADVIPCSMHFGAILCLCTGLCTVPEPHHSTGSQAIFQLPPLAGCHCCGSQACGDGILQQLCDDNLHAVLQEAEAAERSQPPMIATCLACVKAVIDLGIEEEDRKRTWMADADEAIKRGSVETARAIYAHALSVFPGKKSIWRRAAQLEKAKGSKESLDAILKKAVTYCPQVRPRQHNLSDRHMVDVQVLQHMTESNTSSSFH